MTVQFVFRNKRKAGVVSEETIVILSDDECENPRCCTPKKAEYEQVKFSTPPAVSPVISSFHCDPNDTEGKMRKSHQEQWTSENKRYTASLSANHHHRQKTLIATKRLIIPQPTVDEQMQSDDIYDCMMSDTLPDSE